MRKLQEDAESPEVGGATALAELGLMQEFESNLITIGHAFQRWALRCMAASGMKDLAITDVLVLHHVNHRARGKKLADIAFILNIEDAYVVNYSLKKLQSLGLVTAKRHGKERLYSTSEEGESLCRRYYAIREQVLVQNMDAGDMQGHDLDSLARFLRVLSGLYDQAARSAATM